MHIDIALPPNCKYIIQLKHTRTIVPLFQSKREVRLCLLNEVIIKLELGIVGANHPSFGRMAMNYIYIYIGSVSLSVYHRFNIK